MIIRIEEVALIENNLRFVNEEMGIHERFHKDQLVAKIAEYKQLGRENNIDFTFEREEKKMELTMVIEIAGDTDIFVINTIEAGEVIGSEAFDNFEECAETLVEQMLEHGMDDEVIEMAIVHMLKIDVNDKHTRFILDLLKDHYEDLEQYK